MLDINLELTNHCNARCVFCVAGNPDIIPHNLEKKGFMSEKLFHKIVKDLSENVYDPFIHPKLDGELCVRFTGFGEPLLHPKFLEFFHITTRIKGLTKIMLTTNGQLLTKHMLSTMLDYIKNRSFILELNVGLDANTEATRQKIKGLSKLSMLKDTLNHMLFLRQKHNLTNLKPIFQFILGYDNKQEVAGFVDYWSKQLTKHKIDYEICNDYPKRDCGTYIWIKKRDGSTPEEDKKNTKLHKQVTTKWVKHSDNKAPTSSKTDVCPWAFNAANITWNGLVTPCCMDVDLELCIGDLKKQTLKEIYHSEYIMKLKNAHILRDLKEFPHCYECGLFYRDMGLDEDSLKNHKRIAKI